MQWDFIGFYSLPCKCYQTSQQPMNALTRIVTRACVLFDCVAYDHASSWYHDLHQFCMENLVTVVCAWPLLGYEVGWITFVILSRRLMA